MIKEYYLKYYCLYFLPELPQFLLATTLSKNAKTPLNISFFLFYIYVHLNKESISKSESDSDIDLTFIIFTVRVFTNYFQLTSDIAVQNIQPVSMKYIFVIQCAHYILL